MADRSRFKSQQDKVRTSADNAKDDSHHIVEGPHMILSIDFCRFGHTMRGSEQADLTDGGILVTLAE